MFNLTDLIALVIYLAATILWLWLTSPHVYVDPGMQRVDMSGFIVFGLVYWVGYWGLFRVRERP